MIMGMHTHIPRLRAMRVIEMAQAISLAMGDGSEATELLRLAGMSEKKINQFHVRSMQASRGT